MAYRIDYIEVNRVLFEKTDSEKEYIDNFLKEVQVINVETLEKSIRFWYKQDN